MTRMICTCHRQDARGYGPDPLCPIDGDLDAMYEHVADYVNRQDPRIGNARIEDTGGGVICVVWNSGGREFNLAADQHDWIISISDERGVIGLHTPPAWVTTLGHVCLWAKHHITFGCSTGNDTRLYNLIGDRNMNTDEIARLNAEWDAWEAEQDTQASEKPAGRTDDWTDDLDVYLAERMTDPVFADAYRAAERRAQHAIMSRFTTPEDIHGPVTRRGIDWAFLLAGLIALLFAGLLAITVAIIDQDGHHPYPGDNGTGIPSCQEDESCWNPAQMGNRTGYVCRAEPSDTPGNVEIIVYHDTQNANPDGFWVPCPT